MSANLLRDRSTSLHSYHFHFADVYSLEEWYQRRKLGQVAVIKNIIVDHAQYMADGQLRECWSEWEESTLMIDTTLDSIKLDMVFVENNKLMGERAGLRLECLGDWKKAARAKAMTARAPNASDLVLADLAALFI
jgi:hypothetical protein